MSRQEMQEMTQACVQKVVVGMEKQGMSEDPVEATQVEVSQSP